MTFTDYYLTKLSDKQKVECRDNIMTALSIKKSAFYDKLKYNSFKPIEMKEIARLLDVDIEILFPDFQSVQK